VSLLLPPLPPTFDAALRDVTAKSPSARVAAAQTLGSSEPDRAEAALEGLIRLADDADASVRRASMRALRDLASDGAYACLVDHLDDGDALTRELSVCALGALRGPRVEVALLKALKSADAAVRFQAVASYFEVCAAPASAPTLPLLTDLDAKVRAHTARHLARLGDVAVPGLRRALHDDDLRVRIEAALALAGSRDATGTSALREALDVPEFLDEALDAIGTLRLQSHADAVAWVAQAVLKPLLLKVSAARALIRIGDPRGVPALREVLRALRNDGRSYAVSVVGELGLVEFADDLVRLARRPRGTDLQTLVTALAALLPREPAARAGLALLARRSDAVGDQAREVLHEAL
jgi:HEAT repeat protein